MQEEGALIGKAFERLVIIMSRLRGPDGCPWDKEQTHISLKPFLLEECYEVLEVLDEDNPEALQEELGDLLLQIVFHACIAEENHRFDIHSVIDGINQKLVRRHPHVFGQTEIHTSEEQRKHWESLKKKEGKHSILDGVPRFLPALLRAQRVQQKASTVGFDWEHEEQVWEKVKEEVGELEEAVDSGRIACIREEFGDLLFALVNLARFIDVDSEDALRMAVDKFIRRFRRVEDTMEALGKDMKDATLEEMDAVWNRIKHD